MRFWDLAAGTQLSDAVDVTAVGTGEGITFSDDDRRVFITARGIWQVPGPAGWADALCDSADERRKRRRTNALIAYLLGVDTYAQCPDAAGTRNPPAAVAGGPNLLGADDAANVEDTEVEALHSRRSGHCGRRDQSGDVPKQPTRILPWMTWKLLAALTAAALLVGCTPTTTTTTDGGTAGTAATTQAGPTDAEIATAVRNDINALQANWLPRVADVTYQPRTLKVALQVDRATERELAQQIADAIRTNIGVGNNKHLIDWLHVVDGAGKHITQLGI